MTVRVTKIDDDIVVVPSGYGWLDSTSKEHREIYITVRTSTEQIVINASQVPAFKNALDKAVVEANKAADADLNSHKARAKINANKASRKLAKE